MPRALRERLVIESPAKSFKKNKSRCWQGLRSLMRAVAQCLTPSSLEGEQALTYGQVMAFARRGGAPPASDKPTDRSLTYEDVAPVWCPVLPTLCRVPRLLDSEPPPPRAPSSRAAESAAAGELS
mmetsp:Transcript_6927/g.21425  ORF Transcript_6927/g.21425 Transcript_6927/m.21425 type:complete len:125 (-) Transcript_6927:92-466(-)